MYYIYHIPGVKIGCTNNLERRIREQGYSNYELLEECSDKFIASNRERELQLKYGYKLDTIVYAESIKRITKAQRISVATKDKWLPKVDWKARDEKVDYVARAEKIKAHPNYQNRRKVNGAYKLKKVLLQYNLDGTFIKEWTCGVNEMKNYGFDSAGTAARLKKGTLYGFQWRYKTSENYPKNIEKFENKIHQKVIQKDLKGNIIKIWDNQTQAANSIGCSIHLISRCAKGLNKTGKGFIWEKYA